MAKKTVEITVPVYNEEKELAKNIATLYEFCQKSLKSYDWHITIGSRLAKGARVEGRTFLRELTSRALNFFFIRFFFHTHFTDAQCGFKGVTRKVVENLLPKVKDNEWFFDVELLIIAEKSGYKIYEQPVHWVDNPGSTVRLISTIWGDLMSIKRLYQTKPWQII